MGDVQRIEELSVDLGLDGWPSGRRRRAFNPYSKEHRGFESHPILQNGPLAQWSEQPTLNRSILVRV